MKRSAFFLPHVLPLILILICSGLVSAQHAAMATNPSAQPYFQSVELKTGKKQTMDFTVRFVGSVRGRVFNDEDAAADSQGIGGVKVSLKSRDAGFERFVIEQYSDENGIYSFDDLRPGKYTIEIDVATLPSKFRMPGKNGSTVDVLQANDTKLDLPVAPQRIIKGNIFVDRDRDGQFKPGKDVAVEGASVAVGGNLTVSDINGAYSLRGLPSGRISMLVTRPKSAETTHVVLDLGPGAEMNRVVNVPFSR